MQTQLSSAFHMVIRNLITHSFPCQRKWTTSPLVSKISHMCNKEETGKSCMIANCNYTVGIYMAHVVDWEDTIRKTLIRYRAFAVSYRWWNACGAGVNERLCYTCVGSPNYMLDSGTTVARAKIPVFQLCMGALQTYARDEWPPDGNKGMTQGGVWFLGSNGERWPIGGDIDMASDDVSGTGDQPRKFAMPQALRNSPNVARPRSSVINIRLLQLVVFVDTNDRY
jgi:hypothetical protein